MTRRKHRLNAIAAAITIAISTHASADTAFVNGAHLPTNAKPTCTAEIGPWFRGGQPSANDWVKPANSLDPVFGEFQTNTRCDFYKWGAQMFLWLTSGPTGRQLFSTPPTFYNVSVESDGKRQFLTGEGPMNFTVRVNKNNDDQIEMGQAGGNDVLISRNGSLVYYGLHANDVFAAYTTARKEGQLASMDAFPDTAADLKAVADYAKAHGIPLPDPEALAMELKTSWVDAATVSDPSRFVLADAVVPVFDRSNPQGPWPVTGSTTKRLAMVGMHVVGTVKDHPEMIWSTFEHVDNVPDNAYQYTNDSNAVVGTNVSTHPYDSSTNEWLLLPRGAPLPATITATAKANTVKDGTTATEIVGTGGDITPEEVARIDPWGNHQGAWGDRPADPNAVSNNTDLVSINASVLSQLQAGDVRGNYIQTGSVWTAEGQIPTSGTESTLRGSLNLANTTMETFYQYYNPASGAFNPKNCFGCHNLYNNDKTGISHIYKALQPLPAK